MSRTWAELLGDEPTTADDPERTGMFARVRDSLSRSRRALAEQLATAAFDSGDDEAWERLEEALIRSDVGVPATAELVRRLESRPSLGRREDALVDEVGELFGEPPVLALTGRPTVILVVGVNGTGKTTTIGKLAQKLREHGRSVLVGAADTFRAAAEEQLEIWARRAEADFVGSPRGADPAAVAGQSDGRAREGAAGDLGPDRGRAARDAARRRCHHRTERRTAGPALRRGGRSFRRGAHEARRERPRRGRDRDRGRARPAREARRRGGGPRRSPPVRRPRLRARPRLRLTPRPSSPADAAVPSPADAAAVACRRSPAYAVRGIPAATRGRRTGDGCRDVHALARSDLRPVRRAHGEARARRGSGCRWCPPPRGRYRRGPPCVRGLADGGRIPGLLRPSPAADRRGAGDERRAGDRARAAAQPVRSRCRSEE